MGSTDRESAYAEVVGTCQQDRQSVRRPRPGSSERADRSAGFDPGRPDRPRSVPDEQRVPMPARHRPGETDRGLPHIRARGVRSRPLGLTRS